MCLTLCVLLVAYLGAERMLAAPPGAILEVRTDGAVMSLLLATNRPVRPTQARALYRFGLPERAAERHWLETGGLPICHLLWDKGPIRYSQIVLVTRLSRGELLSTGELPPDAVILVQITGENQSGEYMEASAAFGMELAGASTPVEVRDELAYPVGPAGSAPVAALEVPSGALAHPNGSEWLVQGKMPPGTSGSMTIKIPVIQFHQEPQLKQLRELDFDEEFRRVKKFWASRPAVPAPVTFAEPP